MTAVIFVLAAGAILFLAGAVIFLVIVVNIQRVDRSKLLHQQPRGCLDAATRRFLGTCDRNPRLRYSKRS
jgi:hypothetical protein